MVRLILTTYYSLLTTYYLLLTTYYLLLTPKFLFGWRSALPAGLATKFGGFLSEARKTGGKAQPDQQSVGLFSDGVAVYFKASN